MWELIRDRTQITEEDLENKVLEIDARDGRIDNPLFPFPDRLPSVFSALGEKAIS